MYCLVESIEYNTKHIAGIPRSWVNTTGTTGLWPPKSQKAVTKLIKNNAKPEQGWKAFSCIIIKEGICKFVQSQLFVLITRTISL
jgi:hypothetical protein